jgi:hypothetical protein
VLLNRFGVKTLSSIINSFFGTTSYLNLWIKLVTEITAQRRLLGRWNMRKAEGFEVQMFLVVYKAPKSNIECYFVLGILYRSGSSLKLQNVTNGVDSVCSTSSISAKKKKEN